MPPILAPTDRLLSGLPIAAIDFETTWVGEGPPNEPGGSEQHAVECAIAHFDLGETEPRVVLDRRYRPRVPISDEATEVYGISNEDVADVGEFDRDAAAELLDLLEGRVVLAYNLPFDWSVLDGELRRLGLEHSRIPLFGIDPFVFAKDVHKYERGKKLSDTARRVGVAPKDGWHAAGVDVEVACRVVLPLLRLVSESSRDRDGEFLPTLSALWEYQLRVGRNSERDLDRYFRRRSGGKSGIDWFPWRDLAGRLRE